MTVSSSVNIHFTAADISHRVEFLDELRPALPGGRPHLRLASGTVDLAAAAAIAEDEDDAGCECGHPQSRHKEAVRDECLAPGCGCTIFRLKARAALPEPPEPSAGTLLLGQLRDRHGIGEPCDQADAAYAAAETRCPDRDGPIGMVRCIRDAGHDGAHWNGDGTNWGTAAELRATRESTEVGAR